MQSNGETQSIKALLRAVLHIMNAPTCLSMLFEESVREESEDVSLSRYPEVAAKCDKSRERSACPCSRSCVSCQRVSPPGYYLGVHRN